jgi:RimJ/RimL family protein N-acetyltransferase
MDPDERTERAIRAYGKAGFEKVGVLDDETGLLVIMRLDRHATKGS